MSLNQMQTSTGMTAVTPPQPAQLIDLSADDVSRLHSRHPVITGRFTIPTPPIARTFDEVARHISVRESGCSFAAHSRFGKTRAVNYLASILPESFPDAAFFPIVAVDDQFRSARPFFKYLLKACGGSAPQRRDADDQLERLLKFWMTAAQNVDGDRIVLLIDEAQRFSVAEWTWLTDATNLLVQEQFNPVVICFGQPELAALRDLLLALGRADLLGRFFTRLYSFDGLRSVAEVRDVLGQYDDPGCAEYPEGSGWCYSRFFFPRAYARGWRLAKEAESLWDAFLEVSKEFLRSTDSPNAHAELEVGMKWIISAVQSALIDETAEDWVGQPLNYENWATAVQRSNFRATLGITYSPGLPSIFAPGELAAARAKRR